MRRPSRPNPPPAARTVGSVLAGAEPPHGALLSTAHALLRADRAVHRVLGEESKERVRTARLARGAATLIADSPSWATIARFKGPELADALRAESFRVRRVRVSIGRRTAIPAAPGAADRPALSPAAPRLLRALARSVDNPALSRVLLRLARRGR